MTQDRQRRRGDRHLRPIPGGAFEPPTGHGMHVVRIIASAELAATYAGQHALWMAVNLLARQFGVVRELRLDVPSVPLRPGVDLLNLGKSDLLQGLLQLGRQIGGDEIAVTGDDSRERSSPESVTLVIGRIGCAPQVSGGHTITVLGAGWNVLVGPATSSVRTLPPDDANPLGPYFAACIGAAEAFKRLVGLKPDKGLLLESFAFSLWDFAEHPDWDSMPMGVSPVGLAVPPWYLIGAGAVGQALAAAAAAAKIRTHVTLVDADTIDETNGNRCVLAMVGDDGDAKVKLVERVFARAGITSYASETPWPRYALELPHFDQRPELQSREARYQYELVLSCVDKNPPRHAIQSYWPRYVMGGSTDGLGIQVAAYDMTTPYECLMCSNPLGDARTIEETAESLRRVPHRERRELLTAQGVDADEIEKYLNDPRCGELGERELTKFMAQTGGHDWSVGFVSAAAGTLLAAQLMKFAIGGAALAFPIATGNTLRFSFLRPAPRRSKHLRSDACVCSSTGPTEWFTLWSGEV